MAGEKLRVIQDTPLDTNTKIEHLKEFKEHKKKLIARIELADSKKSDSAIELRAQLDTVTGIITDLEKDLISTGLDFENEPDDLKRLIN